MWWKILRRLLRKKISCILENEETYCSFAENARYRFMRELTVDKMVEGYLEIYNF